jgi:hypothetical protein
MKTVLAITILVGGSFMVADLVQAQPAQRSGAVQPTEVSFELRP